MNERSASHSSRAWADDVLRYWFETLSAKDWFRRDDRIDGEIRARFAALHQELAASPPEAAGLTAHQALAAVIVLDQFPRNMHRGTAAAFASDRQALVLAREAVARGYDRALVGDRALHERLFLYLPFEHSESIEDQRRSVALIGALGDPELTRYALAHQAIIERFGRFPHRNAVLGRASTHEEREFLKEPGSSF